MEAGESFVAAMEGSSAMWAAPVAFAASMTLSMPLKAAVTDSGAAAPRPMSSTSSATVVSAGRELAARTVLPAVRNGAAAIPRTPVMR
ncbi:hypothetical protein [Nocardia abscessus]|uniref:hypothetical protein n=1 Tax=Nocardia abscessus TaxID=120957 RepID=UPI002457F509|nr:hypothetical protein [Nocardia abscessus]